MLRRQALRAEGQHPRGCRGGEKRLLRDDRLTGWSQDLIAQSPPLAYQSRQLGMQAFSASAADFGLGSCFAGRPRPSAPSARALK